MVIGEAEYAGTELDLPGAFGGCRDEDCWVADDLPAGAVVLADPGFVEAHSVHVLDQLEIALICERWVFANTVERPQEDAEDHVRWTVGHPRNSNQDEVRNGTPRRSERNPVGTLSLDRAG